MRGATMAFDALRAFSLTENSLPPSARRAGLESERRYLAGERITEADWRAFPTLLRFDPVYHGHFKCNWQRVQDYPNLVNYLRELYQWPGIKETFDLQQTKVGYYNQRNVNPTGIVPLGPDMSHLDAAHDRGRLPAVN